jgi:peroxiredoxin Q/BCP
MIMTYLGSMTRSRRFHMRRPVFGALAALTLVMSVPMAARAQTTPAQPNPADHPPLAVGAVAPDFELPGATRYGVLSKPVKLSDFKGETVVLAFYFKARTKG